MVSFILIAKDKKKRETFIKEYAKKHNIGPLDVTIIEKDQSAKPPTQSIGIETVILIQKKLFLKPFKSTKKLIIIEDAEFLTKQAQNALLKVLEEPPANTIIFLGTQTKEVLLPTILSRCQIIELEEEQKKLSEKTIDELNNFIETLRDMSIGERLKQAEQLAKDKEKATLWIENLILVMREKLLDDYSLETVYEIKKLQSLHTLLKTTNVNPRFALEETLLSL